MLTLILGGARSGKSRLAQRLAMPAGRVTYVATAQAGDDLEMVARIDHHRGHRPSHWRTVEEPLELAYQVEKSADDADVILVDCLTIWLSNLFWKHRDCPSQTEQFLRASLDRVADTARRTHVILVSNELGNGTVPDAAVTREFRDSQGLLNQWAAELSDEVILTVAGLPLHLKKRRSAMSCPRIVIAGTHSGVGKTTVATGIMAALRKRGLRVQGFKVGPDFIDPGFHQAATGRSSHNLDGWMLSREINLEIFARATKDADLAVVEGVMGLFDGKSTASLAGTTAEMAMWLEATNVLVLDAASMAGSAAAIVHGFDTLVPEFKLAAVVCNKVAGRRHYDFLNDAIVAQCRPVTIGYLPRDASFSISERHLGLHLAQEAMTVEQLHRLAEWIEAHLDLDRLLELSSRSTAEMPMPAITRKPTVTRIGVAQDPAFCFYYHHNLEMLRDLGAELVEFSPVLDRVLPENLAGIYLGGGYPELHAEALSANKPMREAIANVAASGAPIYAECGGFMYLTEAIVDVAGKKWPMVGIFPTTARMQTKLAKLGYIEVENHQGNGWQIARGHEFRYSTMDAMSDSVARAYSKPAEGYRVQSVTGSYIHLHFGSCPGFAETFVRECVNHGNKQ